MSFKREKDVSELEVKTDEGKVVYKIYDSQVQRILETVHAFRSRKITLGFGRDGLRRMENFAEEQAMHKSNYLRGVGATLNDPEQMNEIAELLDSVARVFSYRVDIKEFDNDTEQ